MAVTQIIEISKIEELSDQAFDTFCEDISAMFEVDITCEQLSSAGSTIADIKKQFQKVTAVNIVKANGAIDGHFYLLFDQVGLFVLSGVIVMLPEKRILEEINRGTIEDAEGMKDAMGEIGNLLVGSWDRIFRENLDDHGHFLKEETFIGKPWDESRNIMKFTADEKLYHIIYNMTINTFPPFKCAVVFPASAVNAQSDSGSGQSEAKVSETDEITKPVDNKISNEEEATKQDLISADTGEEPKKLNDKASDNMQEIPAEKSSEITKTASVEKKETKKTTKAAKKYKEVKSPSEEIENKTITEDKSQHQASLNSSSIELSLTADVIMNVDVVWASPDDPVRELLSKMQQYNTGYLMIGVAGKLQGIVSNSNVLGAVSPYLRPIFAKWHRPLDDATLDIKAKWIMSSPVRIVTPDTTIEVIIDTMRRFGGRCVPVVDQSGNVIGIVTVYDLIFKILGASNNRSLIGRTPQAPPLFV